MLVLISIYHTYMGIFCTHFEKKSIIEKRLMILFMLLKEINVTGHLAHLNLKTRLY